MRELVFALEYEPGCNTVADTLADHPDARIRSLSLHATPDRLLRVDHATGPAAALRDIEDAFLTTDYYADCLATADCGAAQTTEVLERTAETLVLYSSWERTPICVSVPHIARDHLGDGLLFDTRHEARHYTWRIIHAGDGDVAGFFETLESAVGDCARTELLRTTSTRSTGIETQPAAPELPPEQEAALGAAVDHGYYETPRAVDVGELAEHLDVPRSTLAYRLRRAEERIISAYASQEPTGIPPTAPL